MASEPSLDEIISMLNHSNALTLVIEGKDDYVALEQFEQENVEWGFTVLPVKGRSRVMQLIERRAEIANPCIFFLMDQDEWCLIGVPAQFQLDWVALTSGASIENDLISDGNPMSLMNLEEQDRFWQTIDSFSEVFRRMVYNHINAIQDHSYGTSLRVFLNQNLNRLPEWEEFCHRCQNMVEAPVGVDRISFIRGKTVLELVTMVLSSRKRRSKYSRANILEIGSRARGEKMRVLEEKILSFFERTGCKDGRRRVPEVGSIPDLAN